MIIVCVDVFVTVYVLVCVFTVTTSSLSSRFVWFQLFLFLFHPPALYCFHPPSITPPLLASPVSRFSLFFRKSERRWAERGNPCLLCVNHTMCHGLSPSWWLALLVQLCSISSTNKPSLQPASEALGRSSLTYSYIRTIQLLALFVTPG